MQQPAPTTPSGPVTAHILLAHGSRDPRWAAAVEAVAERVRQLDPAAHVCCAYLGLAQPDLTAAMDQLLAQGAQTIAVWPILMGLGRHARTDLPRLVAAAQSQLQTRDPGVRLTLQPAIAEHAPVLDAMAQVIAHQAG